MKLRSKNTKYRATINYIKLGSNETSIRVKIQIYNIKQKWTFNNSQQEIDIK